MREREWRSKPHVRPLRRAMTKAEIALWARLKGRQLKGCKFRRQHPIDDYVADFACLEASLVVEVDGSVHQENDQLDRDASRTADLMALGWSILRFDNESVLYRTDEVLQHIASRLPPPTGFTGHPPPVNGGGVREAQGSKQK